MKIVSAIVSGVIGVAFGILATWIVSLIVAPPWSLGQAFISVGIASFFAAFSAVLFSRSRKA